MSDVHDATCCFTGILGACAAPSQGNWHVCFAGVLLACAGPSSASQAIDISRILISILRWSPGLDWFPNQFPWDLDVLCPKMSKGCYSLPGFFFVRFSPWPWRNGPWRAVPVGLLSAQWGQARRTLAKKPCSINETLWFMYLNCKNENCKPENMLRRVVTAHQLWC